MGANSMYPTRRSTKMLSLALERAAAPVRIRKSVLYRWWRTVRTCCSAARWTVTGQAKSRWPKRCFRAWERACSVWLIEISLASNYGNRRGSALADEKEHAHGLREAPAGRFLFEPRVSFGARPAAQNQRDRVAGDRLPSRRNRGLRADLSAGNHHPRSGQGPGRRVGSSLSRALGDRNCV